MIWMVGSNLNPALLVANKNWTVGDIFILRWFEVDASGPVSPGPPLLTFSRELDTPILPEFPRQMTFFSQGNLCRRYPDV